MDKKQKGQKPVKPVELEIGLQYILYREVVYCPREAAHEIFTFCRKSVHTLQNLYLKVDSREAVHSK